MRTTEQVEDWLRNVIGCSSFTAADTDTCVKIFHSTDPELHLLFKSRLLGQDPVETINRDICDDLISTNYSWSSTYMGRITVMMMADDTLQHPAFIVVNTYYAPRLPKEKK
jgi:hypothetical protein